MSGWVRLTPAQRAWVRSRIGDAEVVSDMSWNLVGSIVLHVRAGAEDLVVKAGDADNHHIAREIGAHPTFTARLVASGHAARLRDADEALRVMILDHLPGRLLEGTDAEHSPAAHEQAGRLLRELHSQQAMVPIRAIPTSGGWNACRKRSERRAGLSRSATRSSRPRVIGCWRRSWPSSEVRSVRDPQGALISSSSRRRRSVLRPSMLIVGLDRA